MRALGLEQFERSASLWDHKAVEQIRQAIALAVQGPHWAVLEIGKTNHLFAHQAPTCEAWAIAIPDLQDRLEYLAKSPVPYDALEIEGQYLRAARAAKLVGRRMPRLSWTCRVPRTL
jgi:hypothetical protein